MPRTFQTIGPQRFRPMDGAYAVYANKEVIDRGIFTSVAYLTVSVRWRPPCLTQLERILWTCVRDDRPAGREASSAV
jgi:hypothetical protein